MKPTEAGQTISTADYNLGKLVAYEQIAKTMRQSAGEFFAMGQDTNANIYRKLATELDKQAKAMRKKYGPENQPLRDAAFEFLEDLEKHYNWEEAIKCAEQPSD